MLKLVNIKKDYVVADSTVQALKGVSLEFRQNEFVSVLGPSGCGKTTLLNIIGGLDKYTSGDLVIRGRSTKSFNDRDWDSYRNHRIGFIFQSYNLIPHQTVLANVELALTIAGMSAKQRKKKAAEALKRVGLGAQLKKYPNQLSGGQMQRVAIARALVNDPEILLADEPTGALDTQTSIQIMDLIKEIAKERLVIMVTHNPELAERYSTRIVRLLDGEVVEDSNPYDSERERSQIVGELKRRGIADTQINGYFARREKEDASKTRQTNMSFRTSLGLSAKNLWSKKGRTAVTAVAGSIGIIGVCLVLALSAGIRGYIANMQDDMLSGNPITIRKTSYNTDALTNAMNKNTRKDLIENKEQGMVYVDSYIESLAEMGTQMAEMLINNKITAEYVDYVQSMPEEYYGAMTVDRGVELVNNVYTDFTYVDEHGQTQTKNMSVKGIQSLYTSVLKQTDYKDFISYVSMYMDVFDQAPDSAEYISSQYDILSGKIATGKNEIMLVLDRNGESADLTLAQLGYLTQDEFLNYAYKATDDVHYDKDKDKISFSYEELMGKTFTWYANDELFTKNENKGIMSQYGYCDYIYNPYGEGLTDGLELKVVGILQPKENLSYGCLSSGVYYTEALAEYAIEQNQDSEIAKFAKSDEKGGQISCGFADASMVGMPAGTDIKIPYGVAFTYDYVFDGVAYKDMDFVGTTSTYATLLGSLGGAMGSAGASLGAYANVKTLTSRQLGGEEVPESVNIYPLSFETKDLVTDYLDKWNDDGEITYYSNLAGKEITRSASERENVAYTDSLELIISMINTMVDIVTYGLIAFTSISLVVSSVMIGVITYVSVVERTKEIGVLRSLGARKKDISNLFNAETFIIGLLAGAFGVGITYLISIPANFILGGLTSIYTLVSLPIWQAVVMICVSFALTMISGLIPARAAAKKDPVIALRTE